MGFTVGYFNNRNFNQIMFLGKKKGKNLHKGQHQSQSFDVYESSLSKFNAITDLKFMLLKENGISKEKLEDFFFGGDGNKILSLMEPPVQDTRIPLQIALENKDSGYAFWEGMDILLQQYEKREEWNLALQLPAIQHLLVTRQQDLNAHVNAHPSSGNSCLEKLRTFVNELNPGAAGTQGQHYNEQDLTSVTEKVTTLFLDKEKKEEASLMTKKKKGL